MINIPIDVSREQMVHFYIFVFVWKFKIGLRLRVRWYEAELFEVHIHNKTNHL
jgi:hypothetical protein